MPSSTGLTSARSLLANCYAEFGSVLCVSILCSAVVALLCNCSVRATCAGINHEVLIKMITVQPDTLAGFRKRALISLGYDFLARRSELIAIIGDDLNFTLEGTLKGMIRKSKTDQYGRDGSCLVLRGVQNGQGVAEAKASRNRARLLRNQSRAVRGARHMRTLRQRHHQARP